MILMMVQKIALSGAFGCCVLSFQILLPILFGSALTVSVLVILLLCGESVVAVAFGKRGVYYQSMTMNY